MGGWSEFQGLNAGYVLELYDRYRQDPAAVDAQTRAKVGINELLRGAE